MKKKRTVARRALCAALAVSVCLAAMGDPVAAKAADDAASIYTDYGVESTAGNTLISFATPEPIICVDENDGHTYYRYPTNNTIVSVFPTDITLGCLDEIYQGGTSYKKSYDETNPAHEEIAALVEELTAGKSDYDKAIAVWKWISDHTTYNYARDNCQHGAYETFTERTGVCADFAHLACLMLRLADVTCAMIGTHAPPAPFEGETHAYCMVLCNGIWYKMDPTGTYMEGDDLSTDFSVGRAISVIDFLGFTITGEAGSYGENWCRANGHPCITYEGNRFTAHANHTYETTTTEATESGHGHKTTVCTTCGEVISDTVLHRYDRIITPASLGRDGENATECPVCGERKSSDVIPAIASAELQADTFPYDGKEKTPKWSVKDRTQKTVPETYYGVSYPDGRTGAGTHTAVLTFSGKYEGTVTKEFTIEQAKAPKNVTLAKTSYAYDGKAKKPAVAVKDSAGKAVSGEDYTVTYPSGCKNPGTYTVKVTFQKNYEGTVTKTFTILPKKAAISGATSPKAGQLKVTAKRDSTVTGYQVQVAKNSTFTSGKKTATLTKNTATTKTFTGLSKKKTYYVRVRSYKKSGTKTLYGAWSTIKKAKTK